jgi:predicted NAD/FAD-binding protein
MEKLAIVGTGIAGMGCGHLLQHKYDIHLFEQNDYIGGHTNTIFVSEGEKEVSMDTGFMVFNYKTYPELCKLFEEIGAPVKKTDMSFSVQHVPSGLEYCGSGLNGLFAQRKNIFSPKFIRMLMKISKFNKLSVQILDDAAYDGMTIGEYIEKHNFGEDMLWKYLVPMSAAVWSTPMDKMLDFPAKTLIRFFFNHGFLGLNTQHQWYTLEGGSESYKKILIAPFKDKIRVNFKVISAERTSDGKVLLTFIDGRSELFDKVIFASHGDQTLAVLKDPTPLENELLSCFKYQYNKATVHTDESIMPKTKKVWSSWNYRIVNKNQKQEPTTIYWMNSLQGVSDKHNYFVSINAEEGSVHPSKIIREFDYEHPLFDVDAIKAQDRLQELNSEGPVYYCGSYFKYGFHEDAYASAVKLCDGLI